MAHGIKTGGRQKGSLNRTSKEVREFLKTIFDSTKEDVLNDIKALRPRDRLQFFERVVSYLIAKPATSLDIQTEYRHMERLLKETPSEYLETLEQKLYSLNTRTNDDSE
jgi:hypothetical protein